MTYKICLQFIDEENPSNNRELDYKLHDLPEITFNKKHGTGVGNYPRCATVHLINFGPTYLSIPIYYEFIAHEHPNAKFVENLIKEILEFFKDDSKNSFEKELGIYKLKLKEKIIISKEDY